MMVTISGTNDFMRNAELRTLVQQFALQHGDMAIERFDGEEDAAAPMVASLQSLPFLSARKLVLLREPGKQKAFSEALETILSGIADTTDLIVYEPKPDKRSSYYKQLKKLTDFREYNELDGSEVVRWARQYVTDCGGTLDAATARLLIDRVGPSQQLLKSELDKLVAYDANVSRGNVELLTEPLPQSSIFTLLDAAFSGDTKRAIALYDEQRSLKVEPQAILAMLAWQLHSMALVRSAGQRAVEDIAREAKISPFVVRKNQAIVRQVSQRRMKAYISRLLAIELATKRSAVDADEALRLYILQLAED